MRIGVGKKERLKNVETKPQLIPVSSVIRVSRFIVSGFLLAHHHHQHPHHDYQYRLFLKFTPKSGVPFCPFVFLPKKTLFVSKVAVSQSMSDHKGRYNCYRLGIFCQNGEGCGEGGSCPIDQTKPQRNTAYLVHFMSNQ